MTRFACSRSVTLLQTPSVEWQADEQCRLTWAVHLPENDVAIVRRFERGNQQSVVTPRVCTRYGAWAQQRPNIGQQPFAMVGLFSWWIPKGHLCAGSRYFDFSQLNSPKSVVHASHKMYPSSLVSTTFQNPLVCFIYLLYLLVRWRKIVSNHCTRAVLKK